MILVDVNLLLYAYNPSFPLHAMARDWWEHVLSEPGPVRLAWMTILAFLRISTNPRSFESPLTTEEAAAFVSEWLSLPMVDVLEPGEHYWEILSELLRTTQSRGASVMDAYLAALAIEHGATLCTSDRDFIRFPGLKVLNPVHPAG